jgi:hypothetical protein
VILVPGPLHLLFSLPESLYPQILFKLPGGPPSLPTSNFPTLFLSQ